MPRERRSKYGNDAVDNAGLASQLAQNTTKLGNLPPLNLLDYNVALDGSADAGAILNSVITEASAKGRKIICPTGTLKINTAVILTNNTHIDFDNVKIISDNASLKVFQVPTAGGIKSNISIRGCIFDSVNGLDLFGVDNFVMTRNKFINMTASCYLRQIRNGIISENFVDTTPSGIMGIQLEGSGVLSVKNVIIKNNIIMNTGDNGIAVRAISQGVEYVVIEGNIIENAGKAGIKVSTETSNANLFLNNVVVSSNIVNGWSKNVEEGAIAVGNYNTNGATMEGVIVNGNNCISMSANANQMHYIRIQKINKHSTVISNNVGKGGTKYSGILIENSPFTNCSDNTIELAGQQNSGFDQSNCAIYMGGSNYCTVIGNVIKNTGSSTQSAYGISVYRSQKNIISKNMLIDDRATKYQTYAIVELDGGGDPAWSSKNLFEGNFAEGYVTAAYGFKTARSKQFNNIYIDGAGVMQVAV